MDDSRSFACLTVAQLQKYLRERGISVTGYNREGLLQLANAAKCLNLTEDPDLLHTHDDFTEKLRNRGVPSSVTDPFTADGYSQDFSNMPSFGLIDIFNYLLCSRSDYDGKKLKSYKSFEDYRLFYDGHVEMLEINNLSDDSQVCLFRAKVKPTQRDKTYLNQSFYQLFIVMDKVEGDVKMAYCHCIGGSDGACRHIGAALYAIENVEPASCTDGGNQWMKRPRLHDAAVPVKNLTVLKARYGTTPVINNVSPDVDSYDPRAPEDRTPYTQEQKRDFGLQLSKLSPDVQALDILLCPEDLISMKTSDQKSITDLSIQSKAQCYVSDHKDKFVNCESLGELETICDDFYSKLTYTEQDCKDIAMCTLGQSYNDTWYEQRAGRLTASNFKQACSYVEKEKQPSMSFLKSIMCEDRSEAKDNCEPLMWGRKKEPVARHMYTRLARSCHKSLKVREHGLFINPSYPALGCSVDGVVTCKCHADRVLEIKCPYSLRNKHPKEVAKMKYCKQVDNSEDWVMTSDCPYYHQTQGQLGLYGFKYGELVIMTNQGIVVVKTEFDETFFRQMIKKLNLFHKKEVLQYLFTQLT